MACGVLSFFADRLPDPLLELRLRKVVVIDPTLVAGVVRGIDVDALDPSGVSGKQRLECSEIVSFNNEIPVEPRFFAFS